MAPLRRDSRQSSVRRGRSHNSASGGGSRPPTPTRVSSQNGSDKQLAPPMVPLIMRCFQEEYRCDGAERQINERQRQAERDLIQNERRLAQLKSREKPSVAAFNAYSGRTTSGSIPLPPEAMTSQTPQARTQQTPPIQVIIVNNTQQAPQSVSQTCERISTAMNALQNTLGPAPPIRTPASSEIPPARGPSTWSASTRGVVTPPAPVEKPTPYHRLPPPPTPMGGQGVPRFSPVFIPTRRMQPSPLPEPSYGSTRPTPLSQTAPRPYVHIPVPFREGFVPRDSSPAYVPPVLVCPVNGAAVPSKKPPSLSVPSTSVEPYVSPRRMSPSPTQTRHYSPPHCPGEPCKPPSVEPFTSLRTSPMPPDRFSKQVVPLVNSAIREGCNHRF